MLSWQQRIDRARETYSEGLIFKKTQLRGFTREDRALALDWMTCSCGQLDARIPRNFDIPKNAKEFGFQWVGCPIDKELNALGLKFSNAVSSNEIDRAEVLYRKIQARAELLIEQIEQAERTKSTEPESVETSVG